MMTQFWRAHCSSRTNLELISSDGLSENKLFNLQPKTKEMQVKEIITQIKKTIFNATKAAQAFLPLSLCQRKQSSFHNSANDFADISLLFTL